MSVNIYTDGGCRQMDDIMFTGYGVFAKHKDGTETYMAGPAGAGKTNNVAELMGYIGALHYALENNLDRITFHLDSKYVIHGATQYLLKWRTNGWLTKQGSQVVNVELWKQINQLQIQLDEKGIRYRVRWQKAHTNDSASKGKDDPHVRGNREADQLATRGITICYKNLGKFFEEFNPDDREEVKEKNKKLKAPNLHPMASGTRMVFVTHTKHPAKQENVRRYHVCDFEDNKDLQSRYFGKNAGGAYYSVLFTKKAIEQADQVMCAQDNYTPEGHEYPALIHLDALYNKKNFNEVLHNGDESLGLANGTVALWNHTPLTRLMSPALLSSFGLKRLERLEQLGEDILSTRGKDSGLELIDISEHLFEEAPKGKQKLHSDLSAAAKAINVTLSIGGKDRKVILTFGVDLPKRNNMAKIAKECPKAKVYAVVESQTDDIYRVLTCIDAEEDFVISESPHSSLRAVCK